MMKSLIINVSQHTPPNRISDTITLVTLNAINGVLRDACIDGLPVEFFSFLLTKGKKDRHREPTSNSRRSAKGKADSRGTSIYVLLQEGFRV